MFPIFGPCSYQIEWVSLDGGFIRRVELDKLPEFNVLEEPLEFRGGTFPLLFGLEELLDNEGAMDGPEFCEE